MQYTIIYSDRKTLCLEIKDGLALVRAPKKCSKTKIEQFVKKHEQWAVKKLEQLSQKPVSPISREYSQDEICALKLKAKQIILPRALELSQKSGLVAQSFGITAARTRFGSCSAQNSINFSCFLALYKQPYIDYVIMHELCHTLIKNHSPSFYRLLEQYVPNCKELQAGLKKGNADCFSELYKSIDVPSE